MRKKVKNVFDVLKHNPLLNGIGYSEFEQIYHCVQAKTKTYGRGDIILLSGDKVRDICVILSGSVKIIKEDADGNALILTVFTAPETFGEVFAFAGVDHSPVTVQASENCEILFVDYRRVITLCSSACEYHSRLVENMLATIAQKNLMLSEKLQILSKRTTRAKLLAFFDAKRGMATKFTIPYSREEMANYLCVDRSAMSNELSKMRDDGLLRFHKNEFELLSANGRAHAG